MIVFKAECGHTVRARDEDAGGVVRCSYCGRNASVPEAADSSLNFLLSEIEQTAGSSPPPRKRKGWISRRRAARAAEKATQFDPFGLILRLCYFAALAVIVVIVARKFVVPLFDSEERARRLAASGGAGANSSGGAPVEGSTPRRGRGLLTDGSLTGLYAASTPPGAEVFVLEESKAPSSGRIHRMSGVRTLRTNGFLGTIPDGTYVVEAAFAWNDPALSDPSLPNHQEYLAFRRSIERVSDSERRRRIEEYFLPDEATAAFASEEEERIYLVRQYRGVTVRQGRSAGVRALFLPRLGRREGRPFSLEALTAGYLPATRSYGFDESHVLSELEYYQVPGGDRRFVVEVLSRIGTAPCALSDGSVRLFKIDIHDGAITSRTVRESGS